MSVDNQGFDDSSERLPPMSSYRRRREYFVMPAWGWAAVGALCLLVGVALGWVIFRPKAEPEAIPSSTATVVVRVVTATAGPATATPKPTNTQVVPTAPPTATQTPLPTLTSTGTPPPTATPTLELEIAVGGRVKVGDTGGANLRLRAGPGTDFVTFKIVKEGVDLEVIGGPEKADDFVWWRLKDPVGVIGWAADGWLVPIP